MELADQPVHLAKLSGGSLGPGGDGLRRPALSTPRRSPVRPAEWLEAESRLAERTWRTSPCSGSSMGGQLHYKLSRPCSQARAWRENRPSASRRPTAARHVALPARDRVDRPLPLIGRQKVHVDFQYERGHRRPIDLVRPDSSLVLGAAGRDIPTAVGVLLAEKHLADARAPIVPVLVAGLIVALDRRNSESSRSSSTRSCPNGSGSLAMYSSAGPDRRIVVTAQQLQREHPGRRHRRTGALAGLIGEAAGRRRARLDIGDGLLDGRRRARGFRRCWPRKATICITVTLKSWSPGPRLIAPAAVGALSLDDQVDR